jgi:hypothetical protein
MSGQSKQGGTFRDQTLVAARHSRESGNPGFLNSLSSCGRGSGERENSSIIRLTDEGMLR